MDSDIETNPTPTATLTPLRVQAPITAPAIMTDTQTYRGPSFDYATAGEAGAGDTLEIIGRYTLGTWYLLVNGLWIPTEVVTDAPQRLPLVYPTATPIPTPTLTDTPTPSPTAPTPGPATPTPAPTGLEEPVCNCEQDSYDCLGNVFASRAEAQRCFEYCFRVRGFDVHTLDPNGNGLACQNLDP